MNLEWVRRRGRLRPDAPALADGESVHATWAEFAARTAAIAGGLRSDPVAGVRLTAGELLEAETSPTT